MKGLQIDRAESLLSVKQSYSRQDGVGFLFVAFVFWWFTTAQITGIHDIGGSILLIGLSSSITYLALGYLLNSTNIVVSPEMVTVRHGPLPWPGGFEAVPALIKDCRLIERSASKHRPRSWELQAQMHDGTSKTLISDVRDDESAKRISEQIDTFLTKHEALV